MGGIERFGLPKQGGVPASQAVKADGWLFVAGQVPKNAEGEFVVGGIAEQARQTLDNLMKTLRQAGYGPEDVVKVNVWLDDPRDFAIFNRIYSQYFSIVHAPARGTVQGHMKVDCKVEMDCVAWKEPR